MDWVKGVRGVEGRERRRLGEVAILQGKRMLNERHKEKDNRCGGGTRVTNLTNR